MSKVTSKKKPVARPATQASGHTAAQAAGWYVHIQGENVGPMSTETIQVMLQQNRLQFADYIWGPGLTKWQRVMDIDEFVGYLPQYPKKPIPKATLAVVEEEIEEPVQEPAEEEIVEEESVEEVSVEEPEAPPPAPAPRSKPVLKAVVTKQAPATPAKSVATKTTVSQSAPVAPKPVAEAPKVWPKIRYFLRVPIDATVEVEGHGKFKAENVSEGGVFLKSNTTLPVGTEVKIKLVSDLLGKALDMTGIVIRMNEQTEDQGFVIEFTRVNPAHRRILQEYVNANKASAINE